MRFSHLVAGCTGVAIAASAANATLIQNGDFSSGFDNWANWDNTFIEPGFDGDSMKAFGNFGSEWNFGGAAQEVAVTEGVEYTISAEALTYNNDSIAGTQNQGLLAIDWFGADGSYWYSENTLLIDGTYSEDTVHAGSFNVTAPAGVGFGKVVIGILQPAFEGGSIYFDNVAMRAVPAPGALALLGLAGFAARRRRN